MATIFKLIIEDDEGKTTVYPLADGDVSIGRKEGNTIRLMERNVSRRHACLHRSNGSVFVEDLDSYNGIRINGERIDGRYEVKEGDLVEIGDYHLALQRSEVDEPVEQPKETKKGTWPAAGTVPDFQLPDEILAETQPPTIQASARDTIVDEPAPAGLPSTVAQTLVDGGVQPIVNPPNRANMGGNGAAGEASSSNGASGSLPPFPGGFPSENKTLDGAIPPKADEAATKALKVGPAYVSSVPRLVCVSTSYAGKEFALTRPELIIGRVEDNDIVIEHRSVSRNHAKILYDGRTHKIIDLQSANGILVNGEEYAMTDLRTGDLIELGHVRFRFVPADGPFEPTDEEAREMREAGVEPPQPTGEGANGGLSAPEVANNLPNEVGGYDPSTAATVTDTPLSALSMDEMLSPKIDAKSAPAPVATTAPPNVQGKPAQSAPPVQAPRSSGDQMPTAPGNKPALKARPQPSGASSAVTDPGTAAGSPGASAKPPKRATEDQKPTEVNHQLKASTDVEPYPKPKPRDESMPPMDAADSKPKMLGAALAVVALAVVAAVVVSQFMGGSGDAALDDMLQKKHDNGDYKGCVTYYTNVMNNGGGWGDTAQAFRTYEACRSKCTDCRSEAPETEEKTTELAAKIEKPEAQPEAPPKALPEGDAKPIEAAPSPTPGRSTPNRAAAKQAERRRRKRNAERAQKLAKEAARLMLRQNTGVSRLSDAKPLLERCRSLSRNQLDCLLYSGLYYELSGNQRRMIDYYGRFLKRAPRKHPSIALVKDKVNRARTQLARSP